MNAHHQHQPAIRCGVFATVAATDRAVTALLQAGFGKEQISVLCSDDSKERHFREYEHEDPAGQHAASAAAAGGVIGGLVGGLISAGLATATGVPVVFAGPSFLVGGAVAGGLIGAMQTRGQERALADFYAEALTDGKLLVAVEDCSPDQEQRLARAEAVFRDCGAEPVALEQKV